MKFNAEIFRTSYNVLSYIVLAVLNILGIFVIKIYISQYGLIPSLPSIAQLLMMVGISIVALLHEELRLILIVFVLVGFFTL